MALKEDFDPVEEAIRAAIQAAVAPQIDELDKRLNGLRDEIRALEIRINEREVALERRFEEALRSRDKSKEAGLSGLEKRMEDGFISLRNVITYTNKRIDESLEIRERLARLEGRFGTRS